MESLGVVSKVDQPTPWYAGMVVVPKKNSKVRICIDLTLRGLAKAEAVSKTGQFK